MSIVGPWAETSTSPMHVVELRKELAYWGVLHPLSTQLPSDMVVVVLVVVVVMVVVVDRYVVMVVVVVVVVMVVVVVDRGMLNCGNFFIICTACQTTTHHQAKVIIFPYFSPCTDFHQNHH